MPPSPVGENRGVWSGYAWAVTAATIALLGILMALDIASGRVTIEGPTRAALLLIPGVAAWIVVFISVLIPFALSITVAARFNIRSWWYYALCGILTALLFASIYEPVEEFARKIEDEQEKRTHLGDQVDIYWLFTAAALAGAMTFWWKRGRFPLNPAGPRPGGRFPPRPGAERGSNSA